MIRYSLLWLVTFSIVLYAWKDWCKALCGLLILLAFLERPDMPKTMLGITGMNPFNLALFSILLACLVQSMRDGAKWDLPRHLTFLLVAYFVIMLIAYFRMATDLSALTNPALPDDMRRNPKGLLVDMLINTNKWPIPGILLLYGCRTRERMRFAVFCILALYVLLAVQVIRQMPLEYALDGESLQDRALRVLDRRIGYHRVDLAMMLAGAPWALLAARYAMPILPLRAAMLPLSGVVFVALGLTGGRAGYLSWAAAGLVVCLLRWRRYLLLAPVAVVLILAYMPGTRERLLQGIDTAALESSEAQTLGLPEDAVDAESVTSDRIKAWPYVIRKIGEAPFTGFGREGHQRAGVMLQIYFETKAVFAHPHNAYLQFVLDSGLIAFALVFAFYCAALYKSMKLFRDSNDRTAVAVGGLTLSVVLAFLAACLGAQSFYPVQSTVPMWCAMGLSFRLWEVRRKERALAKAPDALGVAGAALPVPAGAASAAAGRRSAALWPNRARGGSASGLSAGG